MLYKFNNSPRRVFFTSPELELYLVRETIWRGRGGSGGWGRGFVAGVGARGPPKLADYKIV